MSFSCGQFLPTPTPGSSKKWTAGYISFVFLFFFVLNIIWFLNVEGRIRFAFLLKQQPARLLELKCGPPDAQTSAALHQLVILVPGIFS